MRNKVFRLLGALTLIGVLYFGVPSPLFAAANDSDAELSARHKTVTVERKYSKYANIPDTIYYNKGGWSGTLSKVGWKKEGNYYKVLYRGTVSCSGPCIMQK